MNPSLEGDADSCKTLVITKMTTTLPGDIPSMPLDSEGASEWADFLQAYARGQYPHDSPPKPPQQLPQDPPMSPAREPKDLPAFEEPLYPLGKIPPEFAQTIFDFYRVFGFLPPPRAEEEALRTRMIQGYNLQRADQLANFDRCTSLVNAFFNRPCVFSLFKGNVQTMVSICGDFPAEPGLVLPPETCFCGHVLLRRDSQVVELGEVESDWRFKGNPYCINGTIKGYVGIPILLQVDPSSLDEESTLAVGVLAVVDGKPIPPLTPAQTKIMKDLAAMLSVQLRSTWEGWRRGSESRLRTSVTEFLTKALVNPTPTSPSPTVSHSDVPVSPSTPPAQPFPEILDESARHLHKMLEADLAVIIDLTPFHALERPRDGLSFSWLDNSQEPRVKARHGKKVLASSLHPRYRGWDERFRSPSAMQHLAAFLTLHAKTGQTVFDDKLDTQCSALSGLEELLPARMAHLAIPFYSANRPDLLVLVASANPFFSFCPSQITYASNLGVILVAHFVQARIVEADAAKTTFVSQISHELRTPLHGLLGQLELLKESIISGDMAQAPGLLESADHCAVVLKDFVNDVLDFGTMTQINPMSIHDANVKPRSSATTDLAMLVVETAQSCWQKRRQWHPSTPRTSSSIKLVVQHQDCAPNTWKATFDVSGVRRILYNLISNSIKYTTAGTISVSLRALYRDVEAGRRMIELKVQDTGCGIPTAFMDRLFEPFTQADSFQPGAGLGLHITKVLVERMHGEISVQSQVGTGSTFTITLPVEHDGCENSPGPPKVCRYVVTDGPLSPLPQSYNNGWCPLAANDRIVNRASSNMTNVAVKCDLNVVAQHVDGVVVNGNTGRRPSLQINTSVMNADNKPSMLRVLVVDDNSISRRMLVTMLKRLNISYAQAEDGVEAVEMFKTYRPHLVWTDVSMPRMDGVTAAGEMRKVEENLCLPPSYIVAITGLGATDEQIRKEALLGRASLNEWLVKGQSNLRDLRKTLTIAQRSL
ncbi:hypothetical protein K439DRAFT_561580 [Ramaria rubella]|nr:hypothetical protein K439DRAFT_561580 [Ramaria rubella]